MVEQLHQAGQPLVDEAVATFRKRATELLRDAAPPAVPLGERPPVRWTAKEPQLGDVARGIRRDFRHRLRRLEDIANYPLLAGLFDELDALGGSQHVLLPFPTVTDVSIGRAAAVVAGWTLCGMLVALGLNATSALAQTPATFQYVLGPLGAALGVLLTLGNLSVTQRRGLRNVGLLATLSEAIAVVHEGLGRAIAQLSSQPGRLGRWLAEGSVLVLGLRRWVQKPTVDRASLEEIVDTCAAQFAAVLQGDLQTVTVYLTLPTLGTSPVETQWDELRCWVGEHYPPPPASTAVDVLHALAAELDMELPPPGAEAHETRGPRVWVETRDRLLYNKLNRLQDGDLFEVYRKPVVVRDPDGSERILRKGEAIRQRGGTP
jgi:hypothetical protein